MRAAALILAHHQPDSLKRLILQCLQQKLDVFIHLDSKSDISPDDLNGFGDSVFVLKNRRDVKWGDISTLRASHDLFLTAHQGNYDYYFHLSGEDTCVHDRLNDALAELNGSSMFSYWLLPYSKWWGGGMFRIDRPHFFNKRTKRAVSEKLYKYFPFFLKAYAPITLLKKHFPQLRFYGGQQWMMLSKEAVEHLLRFIDSNSSIWDVFQYAFIPDELFFHTILLNQKGLKIINRPTHYVRFIGADSHPDYLTKLEVEKLRMEGQYLFARKYAG